MKRNTSSIEFHLVHVKYVNLFNVTYCCCALVSQSLGIKICFRACLHETRNEISFSRFLFKVSVYIAFITGDEISFLHFCQNDRNEKRPTKSFNCGIYDIGQAQN